MFSPGDKVRLKPPFSVSFPGTYTVIGPADSGAVDTYAVDIYGDGTGSDFYVDFLEAA